MLERVEVKVRNIIMYVAFGVLLVGAIVGVIYGVATHEEEGFMSPERSWDHTPLTVSCRGYTPEDTGSCILAIRVVDLVNMRLGFDMVEWTTKGTGDIMVVMRAPVVVGGEERNAPGGHASVAYTGTTYTRCDVRTMNVGGAGDLEKMVLYHEFGHCLGLDHDDVGVRSNNIMKPVQRRTPDGVIHPWISDSDRSLLRERYRGR